VTFGVLLLPRHRNRKVSDKDGERKVSDKDTLEDTLEDGLATVTHPRNDLFVPPYWYWARLALQESTTLTLSFQENTAYTKLDLQLPPAFPPSPNECPQDRPPLPLK